MRKPIGVRNTVQYRHWKTVGSTQATTMSKISNLGGPDAPSCLARRALTLMTFLPPYSLARRTLVAGDIYRAGGSPPAGSSSWSSMVANLLKTPSAEMSGSQYLPWRWEVSSSRINAESGRISVRGKGKRRPLASWGVSLLALVDQISATGKLVTNPDQRLIIAAEGLVPDTLSTFGQLAAMVPSISLPPPALQVTSSTFGHERRM